MATPRIRWFLAIALSLIMSSAHLVATTIDASANLYEQPSLPLNKALTKAQHALGEKSAQFVCTEAKSIKRASGGGWGFFFQSITQNTRYIGVDEKGKVFADNDAYPEGGQFKVSPTLSIEKAMTIASRSKDKSHRWIPLYANWREDQDEWRVYLVNVRRSVYIYVDNKGTTRELKLTK